jgi:hypothetical protein
MARNEIRPVVKPRTPAGAGYTYITDRTCDADEKSSTNRWIA